VVEEVQRRLDSDPDAMRRRRKTVEHPFGTIKARMGATHCLMKRLRNVAAEMGLHVLACNLTRVRYIVGKPGRIAAIRAARRPESASIAQYRVAIPTLAGHWTIRCENVRRLQ
jgi:transposase